MAVQVDNELEAFQAFLAEFVNAGRRDLRPEDVVAAWREREEAVEAFREGLADIEAGRTKPLEQFVREFEAEHGIGNGS